MAATAKVIADSVTKHGKRITTLELRYQRFVHAEFMTHRVFSRNASSSRAIPVKRMIDEAINDPAMPIHWGKNQPGMQAREEHSEMVVVGYDSWNEPHYCSREAAWLRARDKAVEVAKAFAEAGYHKQIVNRLLEPFIHIKVVVTATEWHNFFTLRDHPDAQPEIHALARVMGEAMDGSVPTLLGHHEWHLPYVTPLERATMPAELLLKLSTARCARVSYNNHDGSAPNVDKDLQLYEQLIVAEPLHASPCEHQARPATNAEIHSRNFRGWIQHREQYEILNRKV